MSCVCVVQGGFSPHSTHLLQWRLHWQKLQFHLDGFFTALHTVFDRLNAPAFISLKAIYPQRLIETGVCSSRGVYFFIHVLGAHTIKPRSCARTRRRKHKGVVKRQRCERPSHLQIRLDSCYWQRIVPIYLEPEELNEHDEYAVAVRKDSETVGHAPRSFSCISWYFLKHAGEIRCVIPGVKSDPQRLFSYVYALAPALICDLVFI